MDYKCKKCYYDGKSKKGQFDLDPSGEVCNVCFKNPPGEVKTLKIEVHDEIRADEKIG